MIYCRSGARSDYAATMMRNKGFKNVVNVLGGMNSWTSAKYPTTY